jgi:CarboxypepD_reg-like domain
MTRRNPAVTAAIIGAAALIIAAIIGALLQPSWRRPEPHPKTDLVIAGTVVDQATNEAIGQAVLSIVGRTEMDVTNDNGNFRIHLHETPSQNGTARLHVAKSGYAPYDATVQPPTEGLIVQLKRLR